MRITTNCALVIALCLSLGSVFGQTTAFKYQGSISDGGTPAGGNFQMQFKLFDALSGGTQIGQTLTDLPVTATNGIFSVSLDFGSAPLNGANRWLEISVRRNSGESYVTLSPREQITSSPYSVRTLSAAMADDSQKLGGINASEYVTTTTVGNAFIKNDTALQTASFNISGNGFIGGNVGIGTTTPGAKLDVEGGAIRSRSSNSTHLVADMTGGVNGWARVYTVTPSQRWFLGTSRDFNGNQFYLVDDTFGQSRFTIQPNGGAISFPFGRVGIGTTNPTARLHIPNLGSTTPAILAEVDTTTAFAIRGNATAFNSVGVKGEAHQGQGIGVWGESITNTGVYGLTTNGFGVYAAATGTGRALHVEGTATQSLGGNGLPKAMIFVLANGTIARCFNGVTGATGGGCGFSVTQPAGNSYIVNFGMTVSNRYYSLTSSSIALPGGVAPLAGRLGLDGATPNSITASFWRTNDIVGTASDFTLIVY